jgi:putative restriction endonuclease
MNYWWVNQNQTHRQEIAGGYMWSPKKNKNGANNVFYDNMTKVSPGDLVFSFFDTKIPYLGVVTSPGYSQAKPAFGAVGDVWQSDGWMVNVDYRKIENEIKPKKYINKLRPLLPEKYSPLQTNGKGNQGVYLASVPEPLAKKLLTIIGNESIPIISEGLDHQGDEVTAKEAEEDHIEKLIKKSSTISETEKKAVIKARKGQGQFRKDVMALHGRCPFTGIDNVEFLKAGHLKPWAECTDNAERLDPLNGLPLTPDADLLLDKGFISFDETGRAIFSPLLDPREAMLMGIDVGKKYNIRIHHAKQITYIQYHREIVFKKMR